VTVSVKPLCYNVPQNIKSAIQNLKWGDIMKKATITLAILLFAGAAYGDTATVLRGTKVENWLIYENDGDIQVIGPQGQAGFGQTDGDQTWIYVPDGQNSTYTVIQHDNDE